MKSADEVLKELSSYIPEDVLKELPVRRYHKGDFLYTRGDENIYVILRGSVRGVRYHGMEEIYYPFLYKPGDSLGVLYSLKPYDKNWEVVVVSKEAEAIVFTPEVAARYIMEDLKTFKFFVLKAMDMVERGATSFFIRIHGGTEALLAFGLVTNEDEGRVGFTSYSNLAKALGVSRNMLYKTMNKLEDEGLIQKRKNAIVIRDRRGLIEIYKKYTYQVEE